jgi:small multidrug resistance family-3 protein
MSVLWGWWVDGTRPDQYDAIGTVIAVIGVLVIFYYPRKGEVVSSK